MRKTYKSLKLLLVILLGCSAGAYAQTSVYGFPGGTGSVQTYVVPADVTGITVMLQGATGGANSEPVTSPDRPGYGACVTATIAVTPGQVLSIYVGGKGGAGSPGGPGGPGGGNGGGGEGGAGQYAYAPFAGGGGGGSSDIRTGGTTLTDRIVVAGGGGGAASGCSGATDEVRGGDGGTSGGSFVVLGESAPSPACAPFKTGGGGGGTGPGGLTGPGGTCPGCALGSMAGTDGTLGLGGDAGGPDPASGTASAGGGGGGGEIGGGGGDWTGGGGGSDLIPFGATAVTQTRGCNSSGDGSVSITIACAAGTISSSSGVASLCAGAASITLTDDITGGTWSSTDPTVATIDATTGVLTPAATEAAASVTNIIYTTSPGCTATFSFTTNPFPGTITGPSTLCVNALGTYSNSLPDGAWETSDGGSIAAVLAETATSATIEGVGGGVTTITYSVNGCFVTAPLTVNPSPVAFIVTGGGAYCAGTPAPDVSLSGSETGVSYEFFRGAVAVPGTITAGTGLPLDFGLITTAGTYTIVGTVTSGTGCNTTMTGSAIVTVNPAPAISGTLTICAALTTTLTVTAATSGGTWSSSDNTIATVLTAGTTPTTAVVTGVAAPGTAVITATSPLGCISTTTVNVISSPPPISSGLTSMCIGNTTTYVDATTGGTWSTTPGGIVAVIAGTGTATASTAGTTTVKYTLGGTCFAALSVTVSPNPMAIGPAGAAKVCASGATITLTETTTGGTWSSSNGATATVGSSSGIVTGVSTVGSPVTITYTSGPGCTVTKTVSVNPIPAPITGTLNVCVGSTRTLADATTGGTWSSGTTTIITVGSTTGIVTGRATTPNDTSVITYTAGGCTVTAIVTVNSLPTAITGTLNVCSGATTTLSNPAGAGTWTSSAATVATVGSVTGVVTGTGAGGTSTITYFAPGGCTATAVVTVFASPAAITGDIHICGAGATTQLAETTTGGTWASSVTTAATVTTTGLVTDAGGVGGTSVITYSTGAHSCFASVTVTVNTLPAVITVPAPGTACVRATINLADASAPGTWAINPPGAVATITPAGALTGASAGTVIVTFTQTSTTCTATKVITVNPQPAAITVALPALNASVCEFNIIQLLDATTGGNWAAVGGGFNILVSNGGGGPFGGGPAGTVTGENGPSVTTVTYTLGTGCSVSIPVTVNPLPANITGNVPFCGGTTLNLASSPGGTWASQNHTIATVGSTTGLVTGGDTTGIDSIIYTLTATSCFITTMVTVNLQPPAVITPLGDTMLCPGGFIELTANTGAGLTYQWNNSAGPISGATNSTYNTGAMSLSDSFTVTVSNSCQKTSPWIHVSVNLAAASLTESSGLTGCTIPGDTLRANTAPGLTYQWLSGGLLIPGAADSFYVVTTSGSYSVIETSRAGCSATSLSATITISTSPSGAVTVSGPLNFCLGDSVVFTAGAGYSYQWYNSSGPIPGAVSRAFSATTTDDYWVVETNGSGCSATSVHSPAATIALPPTLVVPSGPTIFCTGSSVTFSAAAGALNYQWFKNGIAIPASNTANYVASTTGNYTVLVTDPATGCSATSAVNPVSVLTTPDVSAETPPSFCWGGSATLLVSIVAGTGPVTYEWFLDGVPITGATASTYTAHVSGTYTSQATLAGPGGCFEASTGTLVTEFALPNPTISYTSGILNTETGFLTYQWYKDGALIPGATHASTPAIGNGGYTVQVTDSNGCQSISDASFGVTGWHSGITKTGTVSGNNDIKIYPNPAQTMVHIEAPEQVHAVISSMDGKALIDQPAATDVDISRLADGMYMITLYNDDNQTVKTEKLVKTTN